MAVTETFQLSKFSLPADEVLTYAPAIYQQRITKQFDVRMVLLGTAVYSFALYNPKGSLIGARMSLRDLCEPKALPRPTESGNRFLLLRKNQGSSLAVSILPWTLTEIGGFSK